MDERTPWPVFLDGFDWRQGEHVSLVGPTGAGKSVLARAIAHRRQYVVVLASKPIDPTLDAFARDGYQRTKDWPPPLPRRPHLRWDGQLAEQRVLLWPPIKRPGDVALQRAVFERALHDIFRRGKFCIIANELRYLVHQLGLRAVIELLYLQGRSLGVSLVGEVQRPAWVPREAFSQATHLFFWRNTDEDDLRRIGGLGGLSAKEIRAAVAALPKHDVLYVNTRDGAITRTRVERTVSGDAPARVVS